MEESVFHKDYTNLHNPTKQVKGLYTANYKILKKETEKNEWKDISCLWLEEFVVHATQSDLYIQGNLGQTSHVIFHRQKQRNLKICMEPQKTSNSQSNLKQKES